MARGQVVESDAHPVRGVHRPTRRRFLGSGLALAGWGLLSGWWHAAWTSDEPWERYEIPATACPRIAPDFLAEERRSMGDLAYRSEYLCEFCDTELSVFSSEHIALALDDTLAPMFGAA